MRRLQKKSVKSNCNKMNALIVQYKFRTKYFIDHVHLDHYFRICEYILKNTVNYNLKVDVV